MDVCGRFERNTAKRRNRILAFLQEKKFLNSPLTQQVALITGASGMLGRSIVNTFKSQFSVYGISRSDQLSNGCSWIKGDILDKRFMRSVFERIRPTLVINSASNVFVNECETRKDEVHRLHVEHTRIITELCYEFGIHSIYISTDSVFDGKKEGLYVEYDVPNPLNYYALTKLEGEQVTLSYEKGLVIRTNIFGWRLDEHLSFGEWVLNGLIEHKPLTMFTDVRYTPISTLTLSHILLVAAEKKIAGLYHCGGQDFISKYDFSILVAEATKLPTHNIKPIKISDIEMGAPRPKNTGLDSQKISNHLSIKIPTIKDSIYAWLNDFDRKAKFKEIKLKQ